jgi:phage protein U
MYAVLGDVEFELITYFDGLDVQFGADYAEHARVGGKPRLQWVGDKLDEVRIQLVFHSSYCDPEVEFVALHDAMRSREARQFVLGNGTYKGWFVITELNGTSRQTDAQGALVALDANVTLREFSEKASVTRRRMRDQKIAKLRRTSLVEIGDLAKLPELKVDKLPSTSSLQQLAASGQAAAQSLASTLRNAVQLPNLAPVIGLVDGAASVLSAASLPKIGNPLRGVAESCSSAARQLSTATTAVRAFTGMPAQVTTQAAQAMGAARDLAQASNRVLAMTQGGTR